MNTQNTNVENPNFILSVLTVMKMGLKHYFEHVKSSIKMVSGEDVEIVDSMEKLEMKNESLKRELEA